MPKLLPKLFKEHPEVINGIQPLVPSLWTGDPATPGLKPIDRCFPDPEAVRCRVQDLINMTSSTEGAVCSNAKVIKNPKPLEDLISPKSAALTCELVRDYNGEYAPCVAAVLGNGSCQIVPARKPSSMKATIAQVDDDKKNPFSYNGCPTDDAKATQWLTANISRASLNTAYYKAEGEKQAALGKRLFGAAGLDFTLKKVLDPTSMNSLHQYWRHNEIPQRFYSHVAKWQAEGKDERKKRYNWASSIFHEAPLVEANKPSSAPTSHPAAVADTNTVQRRPTIVFALWLRWQLPKDHSHNMGQDLLTEIVTAISHVCQIVYPADTQYAFVLFGDRAAKKSVDAKKADEIKFGDYPIHKASNARVPNPKSGSAVPAFILETFLGEWKSGKPYVAVRDFRDLYNADYFKTPLLADFNLDLGTGKKPEEIRKALADYRQAHPRKAGYSYWEQYSFFQFIDSVAHPRFIIGAESGNMDGFGYCGIPVISVDVEDAAAVDESILTDRIGQYCLLTPLWNLLNYHRGADDKVPAFRQHLYGAILMYTQYAGALHATKLEKDDSTPRRKQWDEGGDALASLFKSAEKQTNVIEESLKAQYHIIDVAGDGNCLFRALSRARTANEDRHLLYRQRAVRYASLFFDEAMLLAGSNIGNADDYEETMKTAASSASDEIRYGGFVEIEAFALREDITIEVYSEIAQVVVSNPGRAETVRIFYVNRNHYKAIV